ncbi:helix-turn-helix domain-containing protein [Terasakiella sp. SH-1]|uniref:helix-turn-helix transcriptional regulator n=1 Tax=Terasakiella sp. SH-1 TaxID=2560057 RepID=UPI0010742577|nr:helix-turn-helix domain-containing protein [Terasakiella sp. SH-1]
MNSSIKSPYLPDNVANNEPAGRPIPTDPDALLFPAEAGYLLGNSTGTLANWRVQGKGPSFITCGRKQIRYRRTDVLRWIADNSFSSTSEAGVGQ